jgi:sugar (pentulose or hexulose) kinase
MKAMLHDPAGHALHAEQRDNVPRFHGDGRVEQDPAAWQAILPAVLRGCAEAARAGGVQPVCVAVTAQRSSVIAVDAAGVPLHPAIMWQDRRTAGLAQAMEAANDWAYRRSGVRISPVFSALKMTWLRHHQPGIWDRTHKLLGIQDWILYLATGRFVTDHSLASRTGLLALEDRRWDPDLLALFQVEPRMLCELVPPGSVVGGLTPAMAAASGLAPGLPVVSAGGDQQCAALGMGLFSGERAVANTGTGSYLIGHSDRPVLDPDMHLACNVSALPGAYVVEAAVLTSGTVYRWLREILSGDGAQPLPYQTLDAEAERVPPGAGGIVFLPHFQGSGAPHWDPGARGTFHHLTLGTTRGDLVRAVLEGIALAMQEGLELVEGCCGPARSVSVAGGLTRSSLFNQIQSDTFGRPVLRFAQDEATSLGAWIAGAVATGLEPGYPQAFARATEGGTASTFRPDPANHEAYQRSRRRSRALYQALAAPEFREQCQ